MSIGIVRHWKSEFTDAGVFAPVWWKKSPLNVCSTCRDHVPFAVTFQVEAMYHWGPCWDSQLPIATWMAAVARYHLDSTAEHLEHLEHLIAPLLKAGWKVDDFYLYDDNLGGNAAWQAKAATFEPDPTLSKVERQDLDAAMAIAKKLKTFGADVVCSKVFNHYDNSADDRSFISGSDLVTPTAGLFWENVGHLLLAILFTCTKRSTCCGNKLKIWSTKKKRRRISVFIRHVSSCWFAMMLTGWRTSIWMLQITGTVIIVIVQPGEATCFPWRCCFYEMEYSSWNWLRVPCWSSCKYSRQCLQVPCLAPWHGNSWLQHLIRTRPNNSELSYGHLANFTGTEVTEVPAGLIPMQRVGRLQLAIEGKILIPYLRPDLPCWNSTTTRSAGKNKELARAFETVSVISEEME